MSTQLVRFSIRCTPVSIPTNGRAYGANVVKTGIHGTKWPPSAQEARPAGRPPSRGSQSPMSSQPANFDRIARPYRWLEYLTLGRTLERCRLHHLPALLSRRRALVLGDGDGRFLARLLAKNPHLEADAVDTSAAMLQLLRQTCEAASNTTQTRLRTHHTSALTFPARTPARTYDLVITHFFLDCLTQPELDHLITRTAPALTPGALWLISDFRIPPNPLRLPAKLLIRALYLAFRILTGLRTTRLPGHATPLTLAGFTQIAHHHQLAGLLTTELWQLPHPPKPEPAPPRAHPALECE